MEFALQYLEVPPDARYESRGEQRRTRRAIGAARRAGTAPECTQTEEGDRTACRTQPDRARSLPPSTLETLADAVGAGEIRNPAPVGVTDLAYDAAASRRARSSSACPGSAPTGTTSPLPRSSAAPSRCSWSGRSRCPRPSSSSPDARLAMALAADAFFGRPTRELEVVGVTGTNGKTTTAFLLYSILAAAGRRPGLLGTVEMRVGGERRAVTRTTPEAIDLQRTFRELLDAGDRSCAMEASSHASELKRLVGTRFAALVFTNLSQDHLDFHGTMEAYYDAKRRLFTEPDVDGNRPPAAVNVGDPLGRRLADELRGLGGRVLTFGLADDADVRAEELELTPAATSFRAAGLDRPPAPRGPLQRRERPRRRRRGRLLEIPDEAIVRGVEHVGAACPGASRRSTRAAVRRARRLRPHARGARERPRRGARGSRPAASSASSAAAATATGPSGR